MTHKKRKNRKKGKATAPIIEGTTSTIEEVKKFNFPKLLDHDGCNMHLRTEYHI
jgi:hypothetical protein